MQRASPASPDAVPVAFPGGTRTATAAELDAFTQSSAEIACDALGAAPTARGTHGYPIVTTPSLIAAAAARIESSGLSIEAWRAMQDALGDNDTVDGNIATRARAICPGLAGPSPSDTRDLDSVGAPGPDAGGARLW